MDFFKIFLAASLSGLIPALALLAQAVRSQRLALGTIALLLAGVIAGPEWGRAAILGALVGSTGALLALDKLSEAAADRRLAEKLAELEDPRVWGPRWSAWVGPVGPVEIWIWTVAALVGGHGMPPQLVGRDGWARWWRLGQVAAAVSLLDGRGIGQDQDWQPRAIMGPIWDQGRAAWSLRLGGLGVRVLPYPPLREACSQGERLALEKVHEWAVLVLAPSSPPRGEAA